MHPCICGAGIEEHAYLPQHDGGCERTGCREYVEASPRPDWRGPHVQTATGGHWFAFSPRVEDVRIEDLFLALPRINRFGGHLRSDVDLYSDAEHGVRCAWLVRDWGGSALQCLGALHHDSHEAYPPADQLGPFLRAMSDREACALLGLSTGAFDGVGEVIRRAKTVTREALRISGAWSSPESAALIKRADMVMLATERRDLMTASVVDWGALPEPIGRRIHPWSVREARAQFIATHEQLCSAFAA